MTIHILHVDDETAEHMLTRKGLERIDEDLVCTSVSSAEEGFNSLRKNRFDCIVSDYQMPIMDGLEFLGEIRKQGNDLPFIFLTGQGNEQTAVEALRAGAEDYYTKSYGIAFFERFANSIRKHVEAYRSSHLKKTMEAELVKSETILSTTVNSTLEGILAVDTDNTVLLTNRRFSQIWKYTLDSDSQHAELLFQHMIGMLKEPDLLKDIIASVKKTDTLEKISLELRDGRILEMSIVPLLKSDNILGRLWTFRDVTELMRSEMRLKLSERKFRQIIEQVSSLAIQGYDEERKVTFWNKASEELYGYTAEETINKKLEDLIIPEEMRDDVVRHINRWIQYGEKIPSSELLLKDKAGNPIPVYSSHVLLDLEGKKELFCIDIDLSEFDNG